MPNEVRGRKIANKRHGYTSSMIFKCIRANQLDYNPSAKKSFLFELRLRILVFEFAIWKMWIEPMKFLMYKIGATGAPKYYKSIPNNNRMEMW